MFSGVWSLWFKLVKYWFFVLLVDFVFFFVNWYVWEVFLWVLILVVRVFVCLWSFIKVEWLFSFVRVNS